jgi:hypothetical protein
MNNPKKLFSPLLIGTTVSTAYTVPTSTVTVIKHATLHNTNSNSVEATIYLVPSGDSFSTTNQVFKKRISPGETRSVFEIINATLTTGDTIQVLSDTASSVNFMASGNEVT